MPLLSTLKAQGSHGRSNRRHPPVAATGRVASCGEKRDANDEYLPADRNLAAEGFHQWGYPQSSSICRWCFPPIYGGFLKRGYPWIIHLNRSFHEINHPAIGVPPWRAGNLRNEMISRICNDLLYAICSWLLEEFVRNPGADSMDFS